MKRAKYATIEGVAVVTIPVSHYAELLQARSMAAQQGISDKQFSKPARSDIERNPEIAIFITMRLGLKTVADIEKACRREFGASRTPSRSAIYRYWQKLRNQSQTATKSVAK